ncbi:MAG: threonine/serine exporter family protein [Coriobacteriales bacterium]|jgi:uncharacterized membrane protein YjjP (DUF1212 family)|nr:threonine/serine exporter family protein [Coriobacteriales bacterium]
MDGAEHSPQADGQQAPVPTTKRVLLLAIKAGEIMLSSGAEIYRVEDAVTRICQACDIPYVESYATPSGIFLSLGQDDATSEMGTIVKRVRRSGTDLEKVSRVNDFIKSFCAGELSIDEAYGVLEEIDRTPQFTLPVRVGAIVLVALFFTLLNRGGFVDGACSIIAGTSAYLLTQVIERLKINRFISIFTSCFCGTLIAVLLFVAGLGDSLSAIIIGTITIYLPGVAITNAARDLLSGDLISGVARVAESMLIAVAIAGGVGVMLGLVPVLPRADVAAALPPPVLFCAAFFGTVGISLIVNIPRRYLLPAALIASCGWVLSRVVVSLGHSPILACFAAACLVALLAEIATHTTNKTATLFIIPAIFPLVPGIGLYNTMLNLIRGDLQMAAESGSMALFMAGGIAVALLVVISMTRLVVVVRNHILRRS